MKILITLSALILFMTTTPSIALESQPDQNYPQVTYCETRNELSTEQWGDSNKAQKFSVGMFYSLNSDSSAINISAVVINLNSVQKKPIRFDLVTHSVSTIDKFETYDGYAGTIPDSSSPKHPLYLSIGVTEQPSEIGKPKSVWFELDDSDHFDNAVSVQHMPIYPAQADQHPYYSGQCSVMARYQAEQKLEELQGPDLQKVAKK